MRRFLLALACAATIPLYAQVELSVTPVDTSTVTGGTASFVGTVRNSGSATLRSINVTLNAGPGPLVTTTRPGCSTYEPGGIRCFIESLAPGETRDYPFTALVGNQAALSTQPFRATISIFLFTGDDAPFERSASATIPVTLSPSLVDMSVTFEPPTRTPEPLGLTERTLLVRNTGTSPANRVIVTISAGFDPVRLVGADAPWLCTLTTGRYFVCETTGLPVGPRLPLRLRFETFLARNTTLTARAWASLSTDPNQANDIATSEIVSGTAADLAPILIPLLVNQTPGARATWTSQLWVYSPGGGATMLLCTTACPPDRNNTTRLYAPGTERLLPINPGDVPHGAILYVERPFAPELTFSSRLFNSRTPPSRAVELPIAREQDLHMDRVVIPAVVIDSSHRFLLRVYDPDARANNAVRVRLFDSRPDRVIAERTIPITVRPERLLETGLPAYPGYAELADIFDAVMPLTGSREVGVEIVSVQEGVRLWAFVSATENDGEHVTMVTPQ